MTEDALIFNGMVLRLVANFNPSDFVGYKEEIVILDLRSMIAVLFQIFYYLILARIILSFFPINPYSSPPVLINIVQFVRQVTEPLLAPFRSLVPPIRMGAGFMDLSPILAIVVLSIVRNMLLRFL